MPAEEEKAMKRETGEKCDDESIGSVLKDKKKRPINGSVEARVKGAKVKKEEPDDEGDELALKKTAPKNGEKENKRTKMKKNEEEKKKPVAAEENSRKKEKKVFDLPGQKRDPPEERDPLRIFYESLYQQLPGSEMAEFWMMENGLLPIEVAKKVYEKKQKKNQQQRLNSPIKAINSMKKTNQSVTVNRSASSPASSSMTKTSESKTLLKQSTKRKLASEDRSHKDDDDDDFVPLAKKKLKK